MKSLIYRIVGPLPGKDAPRSERLRWVRRLNWRCSTPTVVVASVLLLAWTPWYLPIALVAAHASGLAHTSVAIRREELKERTRTGA